MLHDALIADAVFDIVRRQLHALHPDQLHGVNLLTLPELAPHPGLTDDQVSHAAHSSTFMSTAGTDPMSPLLVGILASTAISPQARIVIFSTLSAFLNRLAKRELPKSFVPLLTAATVLF